MSIRKFKNIFVKDKKDEDDLSYRKEFLEVKQFIQDGKADLKLEKIDKLITLKTPKLELLGLQILKALILLKKGGVKEGQALAEQILPEVEDSKNQLFLFDLYSVLCDSYWRVGKQSEGLEIIVKAEKILPNLTMLEKNELIERKGEIYNIKGIIFWHIGEVNFALENFQRSLEVRKDGGNLRDYAVCLNNIGNIYAYKGELDLALEHHKKALEIRKDLGNKRDIGSSYGNLASTFHYKGEYNQALEMYFQAKHHFKEINNTVSYARTLFQMITLFVEIQGIEEGINYLKELESISKENEHPFIDLIYRMAQASLYKVNNRLLDKFRAGILFEQIANERIIDHEITVNATLNLCDILLLELRLSGNEEILKEVSEIAKRLFTIANDQKSYSLSVQTYLLESKIVLLDFNIEKAQELLNQAQEIAEDKGLSNLVLLVSSERDNLLNQMEKWEELIGRKASIIERLELTKLEESITNMIQKRQESIPDISHEEPVLFLIIKEGGLSVFSYSFSKNSQIDDQLIGGFITALNSFSKQIFSSIGSVERIKHGEYTLVTKSIQSLTFCYAFKGHSFYAIKKFDSIFEEFQFNKQIWKMLEDQINRTEMLSLEDYTLLQDNITQIIYPSDK